MEKRQGVNKSQAVRDYLKSHPGATSSRIADALSQQGITITLGQVAAVKTKIYKTAAPPIMEQPAEMLTAKQLKKVARAINRIRQRSITSAYLAKIRTQMSKAAKKAALVAAAPPIVQKPTNTLMADQLKKVAQAISRIRQREALAEAEESLEKRTDPLPLKVKMAARGRIKIPPKAAATTAAPSIVKKPADRISSDELTKAAQAIKAMRPRLHR